MSDLGVEGVGVGGEATTCRSPGMQLGVTASAQTQAKPPVALENSMYHQLPEELRPATLALSPTRRKPTRSKTGSGPVRTLTSRVAVTVGKHVVALGWVVSVGLGVSAGGCVVWVGGLTGGCRVKAREGEGGARSRS